MSRYHPAGQDVELSSFARPLDMRGVDPGFRPEKASNVICMLSLQGSCRNGSRCPLVHPPEKNIVEALHILIQEGILQGSNNRLFLDSYDKTPYFTTNQICLNYLRYTCRRPSECRWLHVTGRMLSYFAEPRQSPFAPPRREGERPAQERDSASTPKIVSGQNTPINIVQLAGESSRKDEKVLASASALPTRYDESSASSSDLESTESESTDLSSDLLASPILPSMHSLHPTSKYSTTRLDIPRALIPPNLCRDFYRSGSCSRGTSCRYQHSRPPLTSESQSKSPPPPETEPKPSAARQDTIHHILPLKPSVIEDAAERPTEPLPLPSTPSRIPNAISDSITSGSLGYRPDLSEKHDLGEPLRSPLPTSLPSPHAHMQPMSSAEPLQRPRQASTEIHPVEVSHIPVHDRRSRIPPGYCINWLHRRACPYTGPCPFKHEFPPGWNRSAREEAGPRNNLGRTPAPLGSISSVSQSPPSSRMLDVNICPDHSSSQCPTESHYSYSRVHDNLRGGPTNYRSHMRQNSAHHDIGQSSLNLVPSNLTSQQDDAFRAHPPSHFTITPHTTSHPSPAVPPRLQASADKLVNRQSSQAKMTSAVEKHTSAEKPAVTQPSRPRRPLREDLMLPIFDPIRATFGPGFSVKGIITSNDTRMVTINNIPPNTTREALESLISPKATVVDIQFPDVKEDLHGRPMRVNVQLSSHSDATFLVKSLDGATIFGCRLGVHLRLPAAIREQVSGGDMCVSWNLPTKTCYAGYETEKAAKDAVQRFNGTDFRGYWITASAYVGLPVVNHFNVRFEGMPPDTTIKQMQRSGFKAYSYMMDRSVPMLERFGISAAETALRRVGNLIYFEPAPAPYKDGVVRVWCRFESPDDASLAVEMNGVDQRALKGQPFQVKRLCSLRYHVENSVYAIIQTDIRDLGKFVGERYPGSSVSVTEKEEREGWSDKMIVRILAETQKDLSVIKARLVDMVRGEVIMDGNRPLWDQFFSTAQGSSWLDTVRRSNSSVLITVDAPRSSIRAIGVPEKRKKAISEIREYYSVLRQKPLHSIPLANGLIGLYVHTELVDEGFQDFWLNLRERLLCIRADEEVYEQVQHKVHVATERHGQPHECAAQDKCLVCLSSPTTPVELPCGHKYCKACFIGYLNSATETRAFPIECFGDNAGCKETIPLITARDIMPPADWIALLRAAFNTHVSARPDEFRYCPTPDCQQVYRPGPRGSVYSCPTCLVRICPHCHVEYHEGVTCTDYELSHGGEALFKSWVDEHDVKECPKCKVIIERELGCNHMQCSRCLTHMCWVCMATFEDSGPVYEHMRAVHNNIY